MCNYCDTPATLSNSLTSRLSFPGNGEEELLLYPADYLDAVCSSGADAAPSLNTTDDPMLDDDSSSKESLSFQHKSLLLPKDLTIPLDFELRESGVPGRRLGIWSCRRINIGECFGPYKGERWTVRQSPTQDFEVGTQQEVISGNTVMQKSNLFMSKFIVNCRFSSSLLLVDTIKICPLRFGLGSGR